jgi:hypothetical protein
MAVLGYAVAVFPDILFARRSSFGTALEHREIVDLVGRALNEAAVGVGNPGASAFMLETLNGGRSGAYIFKITPSAGADASCQGVPVVVKIAPRDEAAREKANYDQFVQPLLPAACRPALLGFTEGHGRAALCYAFVGDGERPQTLTDRLAAGDLAALDLVLTTIFETLCQSWYGSALIEAENDLARYYLGRYFEDLTAAADTEDMLFDCAARFLGARRRPHGYSIGGTAFPSLCEALFSRRGEYGYRSCILHGDLNTDNVIVDRDRRSAWLVDFQHTGRGHIYQDLVSLEASVRINYPPDASPGDILEIERLIALDDPRIRVNAYAAAICRIRAAARHFFGPGEQPSAYEFAVATVGLRLMQATDLSDAARARISASALWAAKILA